MELSFESNFSRKGSIRSFLTEFSEGIFKKNRRFMENNNRETFFSWQEKNIFPYITAVIDEISPYMCGEWSFEKGGIKGQPKDSYRRPDLYCSYNDLGFLIETKRYWSKEQVRKLLEQIKSLELLRVSQMPADRIVIAGILHMAGYDAAKGAHGNYQRAYDKIIGDAIKMQGGMRIQSLHIAAAHEAFKDATDGFDKKVTWGAMFYFVSTKLV